MVVLGPTGAGKSYLARRLAAAKGWSYISSGQLLRESGNAEVVKKIQAGSLAPTKDVRSLIAAKLSLASAGRGLVLDGFPRMEGEAKWLDRQLAETGQAVSRVIKVVVPKEAALERVLQRERKDDGIQAARRKWRWYETKTAKVLEHYRHQLRRVNGGGDPEEVFARLESVL